MPSSDSSKKGAAEVADQLGAMSIGDTTKSDGTTAAVEHAKFCSSCGKTDGTLKKCTACKCVYYCSVACQKDHRGEHKKACKRIKKALESRGSDYQEGAEPLEPLSRDDIPPAEDCPVCMLPLPSERDMSTLMTCCGKLICGACIHKQVIVSSLASRQNDGPIVFDYSCAFCRAPKPESDEDILRELMTRAEKGDTRALENLGNLHMRGRLGLPVNKVKGIELIKRAAALGDENACFDLALIYFDGEDGIVVRDKAKAKWYYERAAEKGHRGARMNLGLLEKDDFNFRAAIHHWRIAAASGDRDAVMGLVKCFELKLLRHIDLAHCLQSKDRACMETMSEERNQYRKYLEEFHGKEDESQYWLDRMKRGE